MFKAGYGWGLASVLKHTRSPVQAGGAPRSDRPITPQLWIASDVPDRDFPVKMIDVYPSGAVFAFPWGKPQPGQPFPDLAENFPDAPI